jgi:nucleoside-diphosphate-sugar epimerase
LAVHCASIHPWKPYSDDQYWDANVKGTWSFYRAAVEADVARVVLTSSIAAVGYHGVPTDAWPVTEEMSFAPGDLYSLTKEAQESIARMHAMHGPVRTLALRPPAFMPRRDLETGFALTGAFALVEDVVSAHVAAVKVMLGEASVETAPGPFEAVFTTNALPYRREDAALLEPGNNVRALAEKYWPEPYRRLVAAGYRGVSIPAVYDLSKARRMLGWVPRRNFEWWAERQSRG